MEVERTTGLKRPTGLAWLNLTSTDIYVSGAFFLCAWPHAFGGVTLLGPDLSWGGQPGTRHWAA